MRLSSGLFQISLKQRAASLSQNDALGGSVLLVMEITSERARPAAEQTTSKLFSKDSSFWSPIEALFGVDDRGHLRSFFTRLLGPSLA